MTEPQLKYIQSKIRDIPDHPKPGILFKDITPLLADGPAFRATIELLAERVRARNPELIVGIEARGFILAAPVAYHFGAGFVPVRKAGKLPLATHEEEYSLEYGTNVLQVHQDAFRPGDRVLIVDDVLATGGTAAATCRLVEELGGVVVGLGFLLEISELGGRERLGERNIESMAIY